MMKINNNFITSKQYILVSVFVLALFNQVILSYKLQDYNQIADSDNRAIAEFENAKETVAFLYALAQTIEEGRLALNSKRAGMDFGTSRGFSGAKQAKHLLQIASAQTGYGPGKR